MLAHVHPAAPALRPVPRVVARTVVVALAAMALAAVHLRSRPATLCLVRSVTGVPCPLCGGTTAVADLGRGDVSAAAAASPLALGLVAALPFTGVVSTPSWWRRPRIRIGVVVVALFLAEMWQLARFGFLG